jgi:hypothetical protein
LHARVVKKNEINGTYVVVVMWREKREMGGREMN